MDKDFYVNVGTFICPGCETQGQFTKFNDIYMRSFQERKGEKDKNLKKLAEEMSITDNNFIRRLQKEELTPDLVQGKDCKPLIISNIQVVKEGDEMDLKEMVKNMSSFAQTQAINTTDQCSYNLCLGAYLKHSCDNGPNVVPWVLSSLELSNEESLGKKISVPDITKECSLVDLLCKKDDKRPSVDKFWLHFMAGSYLDFHLDFSGSSIWHYVHQGEEVLYILPSTTAVRESYKQWIKEGRQRNMVECLPMNTPIYKVKVQKGETLILPGGFVRAVSTSLTSVIIGGNFLTLGNSKIQLEAHKIEEETRELSAYRFPDFKGWMKKAYNQIIAKKRDNNFITKWEEEFLVEAQQDQKFFDEETK